MLNTDVLWFFLLPLLLSIVGFNLFRHKFDVMFLITNQALAFLVSVVLIILSFAISSGYKTRDVEIWNSEITSKERVHDTYEESYSCNCKTIKSCSRDSNGNNTCTNHESCDTCYRTHYTVEWRVASPISRYLIDKEDWTNRGVYDVPNPKRYNEVMIGDPVAVEKSYTNYVKAVPETLFKPLDEMGKQRWAPMLPEYPAVYDIYKINRVIPVGVNIPNINEWNEKLSQLLKTTGPKKQANIILVVVNTTDPTYFYALQDKWVNAKKNDIVVVIGSNVSNTKIEWVNVMAYTENSILGIKIRDDLLDLTDINKDTVLDSINSNVLAHHIRKPMAKFKYLENEINPPTWLLILITCVIILMYGGLFYALKTRSHF